jgi:DNA-binding transcriptional LysR family regulator
LRWNLRCARSALRRGTAVFNELNQGVKEIEFLADPTVELAMSRMIEDVGGRELIAENLFDDPYVVVAGAQHPVTRKRKLRLADLLCEHWSRCFPFSSAAACGR